MNTSSLLRSPGRAALGLTALLFLGAQSAHAMDLSVSGVEVTQAIQNYPGNSNPLVAGNHTAARVYVEVTNSATPVEGVTAFLSVYVNGSLHAILGPNAPGFITAPLVPDPNHQGDSLNFTLPVDLEAGDDVDLLVTLDPANTVAEDDETNNTYTLADVAFECRKTPEIVYTAVNYTAAAETDPTTLGLPDPDRITAGTGDDFIFGIYPFPDDRFQYHSGPFPPITWNTDIDSSAVEFLTFLEDCRQSLSPVPEFLYAWFRENPYSGNGRAISIPGSVAFGNSQISPNRFQRTFAHEMGHLFGMSHNSRDLAPDTGWDVENLLGLGNVEPGTKWDIMKPAQFTPDAWVDDTSYEFMLAEDRIACTEDKPKLFKPYPYLTAIVWPWGGGTLGPAFEFPRAVAPSRSAARGDLFFEAVNSRGSVIERIAVAPNFESEAGERVDSAAVSVTFESLDDVQALQMVRDGRVLDRIVRSPNAPELSLNSPRRGDTLDGAFEVAWDGRDADGDELTYIVQYSSGYDDQGERRWVPLAVRLRESKLAADTRYLAGSSDASLRIVAS
ncbi:MAG: hypothetical protein KDD47_06950, partial [Acidobacteria bacterium]|nr:hypothetical protein [Acidobacteriota bacterium]